MLEVEMTDTPRTDANYVCLYGDGIGQWVSREFACELERELAETKRQLEESIKMLSEQDYEYNRKTNALIRRHAEQIAAIKELK
jgi:hypothetical protein